MDDPGPAGRGDLCVHLGGLNRTVQLWQRLIAKAMAAQSPLPEEEWSEFHATYLAPTEAWRIICTEAAIAFPGAMCAAASLLSELAEAIEEVERSHRLLCATEALSGRLLAALHAVQVQVGESADPALHRVVAELDRAVEAITLIRDLDGGENPPSALPARVAAGDQRLVEGEEAALLGGPE